MLPPIAEGQDPEGAYVKWDAQDPGAAGRSHGTEVEFLGLQEVLAAKELAREAMERDAQDQLSKTQITTSDILAAAPGQDLAVIETTLTTMITIKRDTLFNGLWATDIHRRQTPSLTSGRKAKLAELSERLQRTDQWQWKMPETQRGAKCW